ncbi:MAG: GumC family protein, partial [bacterium]
MYEINSQYQPPQYPGIRDYLRTLFRRKWIVLACLAIGLAGAVLLNHVLKPEYEAVAKIIYEEPSMKAISLDPERPFLNRTSVRNLIEQIKSKTLTEDVAQALPEDVVDELLASASDLQEPDRDEFILRKLEANMDIEMIPGSDILRIKATSSDPLKAKIIANTYVDKIIEWNLQKRRDEISNLSGLVADQFNIYQKNLRTAEESLQSFKERNPMITLNSTSSDILSRLIQAETDLDAAKSEREALEKRQLVVEKKKKDLALFLDSGSNLRAQQLKKQHLNLKMSYSSRLAQGLSENHAVMLAIKQNIDKVKDELFQEIMKTVRQRNPNYSLTHRNLVQEAVTIELELETYRAKERGLEKIIADFNRQIQAIPRKELALARLIREQDVNDKIYSMLLQKREELRITESSKVGQVQIVDRAQEPVAPTKPNKNKNLALGFFLGMVLGVSLGFAMEFFDTSLKSKLDIEMHVDLPVLASIPIIPANGKTRSKKRELNNGRSYSDKLFSHLKAGSHIYEAYRSLQMKFDFSGSKGNGAMKSFLVTSPNPEEGKTLTSINVAQSLAKTGIRTLLVDCDLRYPMIHAVFGMQQVPGLSEVLNNKIVQLEKVATHWAVRVPNEDNLYVFPSGARQPNPYHLLNSKRMRELLTEFERHYDLVILDSPPLMAVTDSIVLGNQVDGVFVVIKSGKTSREDALKARELLDNSQTNII